MVLRPADVLREIERYQRRYLAPHRALREVYRPVYQRFSRLAPSLFERCGQVRTFSMVGTNQAMRRLLGTAAVFTLDSALEILGLRRWSVDDDEWAYVDDLGTVETVVQGGQVSPRSPMSLGTERRTVLHCCRAEAAVTEEGASGLRVVSLDRLAADLLGRHGLRADLFARLLPLYESRVRGHGSTPGAQP